MISNDTFYGLVFERDRVLTLLKQCSAYELSRILEYIIDRRFPGWNRSAECFRPLRGETSHSDMLLSFYQKGKFTFADLLDAYNFVTDSSINPKFQSYYVPAGTVIEDDTPAVTDDFEEVQKVELNNPRWEHKDATKKEKSPKKAAFSDTVILMADVTGIPENGPVTFDIFDISVKPPKTVGSAKGKNVGGVAKGEWVVVDKTGQGVDAKLEFQAAAQGKVSTRCAIPLTVIPQLWFHIDLDNPVTDDDRIIVRATDESTEDILYLKDMNESMEDMVLLSFPTMKEGQRYNLIYDPGAEGEPVIFEHDIDRQYLLS